MVLNKLPTLIRMRSSISSTPLPRRSPQTVLRRLQARPQVFIPSPIASVCLFRTEGLDAFASYVTALHIFLPSLAVQRACPCDFRPLRGIYARESALQSSCSAKVCADLCRSLALSLASRHDSVRPELLVQQRMRCCRQGCHQGLQPTAASTVRQTLVVDFGACLPLFGNCHLGIGNSLRSTALGETE